MTKSVKVLLTHVPCICGSKIVLVDENHENPNSHGYCSNPWCEFHKLHEIDKSGLGWSLPFIKKD